MTPVRRCDLRAAQFHFLPGWSRFALSFCCVPPATTWVTLQDGLFFQVARKPGRAHRAGQQPGDTHEGHDVFGLRLGQNPLEVRVCIALFRHGEWRTHLHCARPESEQSAYFLMAVDASGKDQGNPLALNAQRLERLEYTVEDKVKTESSIADRDFVAIGYEAQHNEVIRIKLPAQAIEAGQFGSAWRASRRPHVEHD